MTDEDASKEGHLPDTDKLRRFSLGLGIALLIYVFACGELGDNVQTVLTPIVHFKRPWVLIAALILASFYSSYRYWYYGIQLALTRAQIRKYFRKADSVYVFVGDEAFYSQACQGSHPNAPPRTYLAELYGKLPEGLPRTDCQVVTHGRKEPELINEQVARKLDKYFPGLQAKNITVKNPHDGNAWAHVSSTGRATDWWCYLENIELWLPIIVNGLAIPAAVVSLFWPELFCVRTVLQYCLPVL